MINSGTSIHPSQPLYRILAITPATAGRFASLHFSLTSHEMHYTAGITIPSSFFFWSVHRVYPSLQLLEAAGKQQRMRAYGVIHK